jgi:hypothetical protein
MVEVEDYNEGEERHWLVDLLAVILQAAGVSPEFETLLGVYGC